MKVLITGGSGFLGLAITRQLQHLGYEITTLARNFSNELKALGVNQHLGPIDDYAAVSKAVSGQDAVIHTAAKAGVWGAFNDYYQANVVGTKNVLQACTEHEVRALVHVSSPSVVFDGTDQEGVDESAPYPKDYLAPYPQTKAQAEQLVVAYSDERLARVILRPHLIWGPGDNHLVPRVVERSKVGALRLIGDGRKLVDAVYIDNAAAAHVAALHRLVERGVQSPVNGKIYFVTNFEPWPMEDIIGSILKAAGRSTAIPKAPKALAFAAASIVEAGSRLLGKREEPRLTRFVAKQLATAHWYDNSRARDELGYQPSVSMAEGFKHLAQSFGNPWQDQENQNR